MKNTLGITIENYCSKFVAELTKLPHLILDSLVPSGDANFDSYDDYAESCAKIHLLHMAIGVTGEAIEFMEACVVQDKHETGTIIEELGDTLFYLVGMFPRLKLEGYWYDYLANGSDNGYEGYVLAAGNLLDAVKKVVIYNDATKFPLVQYYWQKCMKEFQTALWHLLDGDLPAVIDHNVEKLSKRYEGLKYSDKAAQVRADKTEDSVQENNTGGDNPPVVNPDIPTT